MNNQTELAKKAWEGTFNYLYEHPFFKFMIKLFAAIIVVWILIIISKIVAVTIKKRIINKITLEDDEYVSKIWNLIEKYFWRIEEITIRYTVMRLFNMRRIIIPNLAFITSPVETFSTEDMIRLETMVSVHYNTDLDKAVRIIKEAIEKVPWVIWKDKIRIIIDSFFIF